MFASRFVVGALLATGLLFSAASPASAFLPVKKVASKNVGPLHQAAHELKTARGVLGGGNGGKANQHLSAAIRHIEQAMQHHKTKTNTTPRKGLTGALVNATRHHHHSQLHQALAAAKAAEKQIASGNAANAAKDVQKAHHHVELAIHHHVR